MAWSEISENFPLGEYIWLLQTTFLRQRLATAHKAEISVSSV